MRGDYDELEWPFEGDIRVELNWRVDKNHQLVYHLLPQIAPIMMAHPLLVSLAKGLEMVVASPQFISHTDLAPTTNTEYLRDDYLKLRVSAIFYSTPLLHLTPAWQDSLSTKSGAQFTISKYSKRKLI